MPLHFSCHTLFFLYLLAIRMLRFYSAFSLNQFPMSLLLDYLVSCPHTQLYTLVFSCLVQSHDAVSASVWLLQSRRVQLRCTAKWTNDVLVTSARRYGTKSVWSTIEARSFQYVNCSRLRATYMWPSCGSLSHCTMSRHWPLIPRTCCV
jgi:hypothetical protein